MEAKQLTNEEIKNIFLNAKKEIELDLKTLKDDYKDDENTLRTLINIERKVTQLIACRDYE